MQITIYKDQKQGSLADGIQTGAKYPQLAGATGQEEDKGQFQF